MSGSNLWTLSLSKVGVFVRTKSSFFGMPTTPWGEDLITIFWTPTMQIRQTSLRRLQTSLIRARHFLAFKHDRRPKPVHWAIFAALGIQGQFHLTNSHALNLWQILAVNTSFLIPPPLNAILNTWCVLLLLRCKLVPPSTTVGRCKIPACNISFKSVHMFDLLYEPPRW